MRKKRKKVKSRAEVSQSYVNSFANKHGNYKDETVEKNGPKLKRNTSVVPLEDCFEKGQITWGMFNAGKMFERIALQHRVLIGAPSGSRDSCDFTVRGGLSVSSPERAIRVKEEYYNAQRELPADILTVVSEIRVMHYPTGDRRTNRKRWRNFTDGLKVLQKHWKIDEGEKHKA